MTVAHKDGCQPVDGVRGQHLAPSAALAIGKGNLVARLVEYCIGSEPCFICLDDGLPAGVRCGLAAFPSDADLPFQAIRSRANVRTRPDCLERKVSVVW